MKLALNSRDQLFTPPVNVVLGVEESAALGVALGLQGFDLFLAGQFLFQSQRRCRCASGFFDLAVDFFNLALKT